jgi:hypothetical protein
MIDTICLYVTYGQYEDYRRRRMKARTKVFEERFLPRRLERLIELLPARLDLGEVTLRSLGEAPTDGPHGARRWSFEWSNGKGSGPATVDLSSQSDAWSEVVVAVEGPGRKKTEHVAGLLIDGLVAALTHDLPATTLRVAPSGARDLLPRFRASA